MRGRARKNLEAAPRIIFAVFHSFLLFRRFPALFAVFRRFSPLSLFFRRFSSFFTVFNRFSQFFILFHRLFTVFSTTFSWIFPRIFWGAAAILSWQKDGTHKFWIPPVARTEWEPPHSILAYSRPVLLSRKCPKVAFPVWVWRRYLWRRVFMTGIFMAGVSDDEV